MEVSTTKPPPPPPPSSKKKDCCCKLADELREAVHKAVLELPDDDEEESPKNKAAYLKAYQTCKSVVHQESDPVRFVQLEEWNIKNAAERLVINWSIRLQLFGPERAFLPLNDMSGNGALSQDDIDLLQEGYIGLLPSTDRRGRSVLWVHNSKASETVRTKQAGPSRARNMFFLCTIAAMQHSSSGGGFCIWRYTDTPRFFDKASAGRIRQLLEAIPIQLDAFYFISLAPVAGAKRVFSQTMAPLIKQYLGPRIGGVMQSHVSENVQELCQIMLSSEGGLPLSSIPECLGGGYSDANFKEWMQRKRIEQHNEDDDKKPAAVVLKQHSAEPKLLQEDDNKSKEDLSQRVVVVAAEKARRCRRNSNEEEQRKARKRKNDMMYARERRRRERQLGDSLKVKCDELRQSNALLREEGHRLETLLSLAKKTSSSSSSQQEKMAPPPPPPPLQEPVAQRQRLMVASASAPAQGNGGVALAQQQLVLQQQQQQQLLMRQQQQQMSRLNSGGGGGGLGQFPPQFLAARQSLVQSTLSPQLANGRLEQRNNFSSSSSLLLGSSSGITPPPPLSQANGGGGAGGGEDRAVLLRRQLLLEALRREGQTIDVLNSMVVRR